MAGTLHLLENVRSICGGYVSFVGNQGGQIFSEGTLTNGKVLFDKVNYITEPDNNLLSISQICDKSFLTHFTGKECLILKPGFKIPDEWILMCAHQETNLYVLNMCTASTSSSSAQCLISKASEKESILWHRRVSQINVRKKNHLVHNHLVDGVNLKNFHLNEGCLDCKKEKQTKKSHPKKMINSIKLPFEILHMDLFGPVNVKSITGELYCFVFTDDYS
ncbi:uncharacterized protein LOC143618298 [Bidens hawaiensis]|uniref:uncharacterized protein LOC143618298 n=1 Tax=Bidens hawaiensis TaxID=980011 RepID=UPI00404B05FA